MQLARKLFEKLVTQRDVVQDNNGRLFRGNSQPMRAGESSHMARKTCLPRGRRVFRAEDEYFFEVSNLFFSYFYLVLRVDLWLIGKLDFLAIF